MVAMVVMEVIAVVAVVTVAVASLLWLTAISFYLFAPTVSVNADGIHMIQQADEVVRMPIYVS